MSKATDLIESIRAEGHDDKAIADALCDGAYLGTLGDEYTQEDIEEAYGLITTPMAAKALGRKGGAAKSPAKARTAAENGKLGGRRREIEGHMVGTNLVVNDDCPYCSTHVVTSGDDYNGVWTCPECGKTAKVRYI